MATSDQIPRSPKMAEQVARRIVDTISEQDLQPGDMLPSEAAMVADMGVGRSTLRESLLLLEVLGLLNRRSGPKGGPKVGALSPQDFAGIVTLYFRMAGMTYRNLIEARLLLQPMSARLAAERGDPEFIARLQAAMERTRAVDLNDDRRYLEVVVNFHSTIASGSGNPIIDFMAQALAAIYSDQIASGALSARGSRPEVVELHARLVEAITSGDGVQAEDVARELLTRTVDRLVERHGEEMDRVIEWV